MTDPERIKELRERVQKTSEEFEQFDAKDSWHDILAILDALPGLQAEVERRCDQRDAALESVGLLTTELAVARTVIEELVDYVREHLADHTFALGETTPKNKAKAADMRRVIKDAEAALAYRKEKEEKG